MVVPPLEFPDKTQAMTKAELRKSLRATRREHVAALPDQIRALVFHRPPAPLLSLVPDNAAIGFYAAHRDEAPTAAYARFFAERGHAVALPRFADRGSPMEFARYEDPIAESRLEQGPFGVEQPVDDAETLVPQVLFVPLIGFTEQGHRLGQGGGHYDRWLADHPGAIGVGLAWDSQLVDELPTEPHDVPLHAVVTPTRFYGPFLMREKPSWRIPVGMLTLLAALAAYGLVIARYVPELIGHWPAWAQTPVYLVLGVVWLLPLRRFLIWMETGHWG